MELQSDCMHLNLRVGITLVKAVKAKFLISLFTAIVVSGGHASIDCCFFPNCLFGDEGMHEDTILEI